ncbi:hypothetical protein GCM10023220_48910 [Streptomyces ziwulingensis]|uniref:Uncharacterized protein n=1 Tax=Streptomyces ziwulingensis TaxID=1045501 RepID=A0ABP9CM75_9ACTN
MAAIRRAAATAAGDVYQAVAPAVSTPGVVVRSAGARDGDGSGLGVPARSEGGAERFPDASPDASRDASRVGSCRGARVGRGVALRVGFPVCSGSGFREG